MNNLFIIGTPLQLINAIEAIKHFKLQNNILVIVHRSLVANRVQMDKLKNFHKWQEVIDIEYSKHSSILKYVNLVKYLKKYTYKYIFISKLEVVPKIIIPNVEKEKVFLLDDGVFTIEIYENNIKNNRLNKYDFKEIRFLFFGLKIKIKDKLNLFTYFNLKAQNGIEIIINKLTFLKNMYLKNSIKDNNKVYFLGHPSNDMVNDNVYIQSILELTKILNKKIVYIPHRGETKKVQNILISKNNPLLSIESVDMPIEVYFLENKIYPTHIISYYSTALITLNIIYEECKISFIHIPNGEQIDKALTNIYKIFRQEKFNKLDIL